MKIDDVNRGINKHRRKRRIGRGPGSGWGKTAARGHKGQFSRSGVSFLSIFQGGAMPLVRRVPKRGFNNKFAPDVMVVNVGDLETTFEAGTEVTPDLLREKGLAKGCYDELKILGDGKLTKKLKVVAHRFSKSATEQIQNAGGEVVVLPGKTPVQDKQKAARAAKAQKK
jgi:large subunit ribosomal protein L15